jgi:hypothetical protein
MLYGVRVMIDELVAAFDEDADGTLREKLDKLTIDHGAEFEAAWATRSSKASHKRPATTKIYKRGKDINSDVSLDFARGMENLSRSIKRREQRHTLDIPPFFLNADFEDVNTIQAY